ncbi:nuclear transport factor 2 family protein [Sphaerisporangium sp. B11E5]|uniref:nuclear transport factor 2 family protein n=1 Tax=Sphaerisporangium sp. B11E5 TaxID=3153563 RepID=UPI00325ECACF
MADDYTASLREAERRLQVAQLAGDADALDLLLDDRLVFTGPDGGLYSKGDDLEIQRTGEQRLTRVDEEELKVLVDGRTGVTWFLGTLAGVFKGEAFTARVRYTRTWVHSDEHGWRLVAAHVSAQD